jgi:hypothetical protein
MKTKAYPPILAACTLLGAPVSAGASTLEVFTVSGKITFGTGTSSTLSGTFDYNGGVFSSFAITATRITGVGGTELFDVNNNSSNSTINALSSGHPGDFLTLLPATTLDLIAPGGSTTFSGTGAVLLAQNPLLGPEAAAGSLTASAVPLPASLPLFAGGLGAMALLRWLRKRAA